MILIDDIESNIASKNNNFLSSIVMIAPKNIADFKLDNFFKTIFKSILNKYKINSLESFHRQPITLFKDSDFKKNTSLLGLLKYLNSHYGFEFHESSSSVEFGKEFNISLIPLSTSDFSFLSDKEMLVFKYRIVENQTLLDVGNNKSINLSRERVRQIESKIKNFLKIFFTSDKFTQLLASFDKSSFVCGEDLRDVFETEFGFNTFKTMASSKGGIFKDDLNISYSRTYDLFSKHPSYSIVGVIEELKNSHFNKNQITFTASDLSSIFNINIENISEYFDCFVKKEILCFIGSHYFLTPKTKASAVESFISLNNGYVLSKDFSALSLWITKHFPSLVEKGVKFKKENFNSLIEHNKNIILWGWGFYVQKYNVSKSFEISSSDLKKIISSQIKENKISSIKSVFHKIEDTCSSFNIPNPHALYSVLREKLGEDYDFNHSPWIKEKGSSLSVVETISESLSGKGKVSVQQIATQFNIESARITQILAHSTTVVSAGRGYFIYQGGK